MNMRSNSTRNFGNHPFFCFKTNRRKTAWDTPEYLTPDDWQFLKQFIRNIKLAIRLCDSNIIWEFFWLHKTPQLVQNFFNHTLGWPEGYQYCHDLAYLEKSAIPGWIRHDLTRLKAALDRHAALRKPAKAH